MKTNHIKDAAFTSLMNSMLNTSETHLEVATSPLDDRHEQLLALQRRLSAAPRTPFKPGQLVQWKAGMRNRKFPIPGDPAIVVEVLDPPILNQCMEDAGSNIYREPLSLALGVHDEEGNFLIFHFDCRRFEVIQEERQ